MVHTRSHQIAGRDEPPRNTKLENVVAEDAVSYTASSPAVPATRMAANPPPAVEAGPDTTQRFIQNALNSLLSRMENLEKRYELQRHEDVQNLITQLDERSAKRKQKENHRFQHMEHRIRNIENPATARTEQPHAIARRHRPETSVPTAETGNRGPISQFEQSRISHSQSHNEGLHIPSTTILERTVVERSAREIIRRPGQEDDTYRRKYRRGQQNNSPFVDEIVDAQFLKDFNGSFLSKYDGSQDPQVHIDEFDMQMYVRGIDEPIISQIFVTTLTGAAQTWFHTLPPRSIQNFEDFGQKFLLNFAMSKKQPKSEFTLGKIHQQPGETLQSYLDRFKEAALQVQGLEEKVYVHLISAGLNGSSRLAKSIYKDPVKSLNEFRIRSNKYLKLEQMEIAMK